MRWRDAADVKLRAKKRQQRTRLYEGRSCVLFDHFQRDASCIKISPKVNIMSVTLEPVQQEPAIEPEPAAEPAAEPVQPKKRGRPKAAPKPKAAAPKAAVAKKAVRMKPPSPISSEDNDEPLSRDDMETLLLDYLVKRKTSQQNARRNMWAQLAGLS